MTKFLVPIFILVAFVGLAHGESKAIDTPASDKNPLNATGHDCVGMECAGGCGKECYCKPGIMTPVCHLR